MFWGYAGLNPGALSEPGRVGMGMQIGINPVRQIRIRNKSSIAQVWLAGLSG